jgi:hypothetical protein
MREYGWYNYQSFKTTTLLGKRPTLITTMVNRVSVFLSHGFP